MRAPSAVAMAVFWSAAGEVDAQGPAPAPPAPAAASAIGEPPAGKAHVVFFRRGRHADSLWGTCPISERIGTTARPLMKLGKDRYALLVADAGAHEYVTKTESTDRLSLEVEAGETYFVECELSIGGFAMQPADLKPADRSDFDKMLPKLRQMPLPVR